MVKKKPRSKNNTANAHVDLGSLYLQFNEDEKAQNEFDDALKALQPGRSPTIQLANAFIKLSMYDYALAVYNKGRKNTADGYEFNYEIANVNGMMGITRQW